MAIFPRYSVVWCLQLFNCGDLSEIYGSLAPLAVSYTGRFLSGHVGLAVFRITDNTGAMFIQCILIHQPVH